MSTDVIKCECEDDLCEHFYENIDNALAAGGVSQDDKDYISIDGPAW